MSDRKWISSINNSCTVENAFSIATYNILSEVYMDEQNYFYVPKESRSQQSRHEQIIAEIKDLDPDVLCLQEVHWDYYENVLNNAMKTLNYEGYIIKDSADCDCLALFYKTSVFHELDISQIRINEYLNDMCQNCGIADKERDSLQKNEQYLHSGFQAITLELKSTGECVVIGNTHIDWTWFLLPGIQTLQVCLNMMKLQKLAADKYPIILAGDFNITPDFVTYQMLSTNGEAQTINNIYPSIDMFTIDRTKGASREMISSKISSTDMLKMDKESQEQDLQSLDKLAMELAKQWWPRSAHLSSSYKTTTGDEPPVTSSEVDGFMVYNMTIDYIWYDSEKLSSVGTLMGPSLEKVQEYGSLPSPLFGSDHIPIKSKFVWL